MAEKPEIVWLADARAFRRWLEKNGSKATEIQLGLIKKGSAEPGLKYPEALDEALCFGWIDAVRRSIDDERWTIRFCPRKPRSIWSAINIRRMDELVAEGRVTSAGRAAYEARTAERSKVYSYEREQPAAFTEAELAVLRRAKRAWAWFRASPPGYQRQATHWVTSAKQAATRERRLASLVACSDRGERLPQYVPLAKRPKPAQPK